MQGDRTELRRWLASVSTAAVAAAYAWTPLSDRDWPWHLADFERMVRERALPWDDRWSYASEGLHVPVHWLFELLLGGAHRALGLDGVFAVKVGLVAVTFLALHRALLRRGLGPLAAAALVLLVAATARERLIERPHLVTLIGVVLTWDRLTAFRDAKSERLWLLLPIFAVWANAHPGVVYGSILVLGFLVAEGLRVVVDHPGVLPERFPDVPVRAMPARRYARLAAIGACAVVATLATPYGWTLYPYLIGHRDMQRWSNVLELRPLDLAHHQDLAFIAVAAASGLLLARAAWRARRDPRASPVDLTDVAATAGFVVLAVTAAREAVLALACLALAVASPLAATIAEAREELRDKDRGLHAFAWAFGLLLGFAWPAVVFSDQLLAGELGRGLERGAYPEREADWILRERPPGPLWNTNGSGGYLLWRLDPERNPQWKVYTDGRQPLFRTALQRYFPEIDALYAPNVLVLDYFSAPYEYNFPRPSPFALVELSDGGRVYVRDVPANARWTRRAYRHVFFGVQRAPGARLGKRLTLLVDSEDPLAALRELLAGAASQEPGGHWANVGLGRAYAALGRREEALDALHRAARARPGSYEVRELAEQLLR